MDQGLAKEVEPIEALQKAAKWFRHYTKVVELHDDPDVLDSRFGDKLAVISGTEYEGYMQTRDELRSFIQDLRKSADNGNATQEAIQELARERTRCRRSVML